MEKQAITFFDLVAEDIQKVETLMRRSPGEHHDDLNSAIDHLLAAGGKRIRPALVILTSRMLDSASDASLTLAGATELLHTATLVHDDLIDGSLIRRGYPTLNAQWTAGATVLTGDYVFARAAFLAAETDSLEIMKSFARTLMTIVNGEIHQLFRTGSDDARRDYNQRIYAKTASLFELSTEGPALLGQYDSDAVDQMRSYGYDLGMAFQIMDDVLDFTAEQERVGKPVGSDLRRGLITLPTLLYLRDFPDDPLPQQLQNGALSDDAADQVVDAIRNSGAIQEAVSEANAFIASSEEILANYSSSPAREGLLELGRYIVQRTI